MKRRKEEKSIECFCCFYSLSDTKSCIFLSCPPLWAHFIFARYFIAFETHFSIKFQPREYISLHYRLCSALNTEVQALE
jgi:hypothetical protein